MEERWQEDALAAGWAWRDGPRRVRLRISWWLKWMRAWLHRLWLIPIADGVPDPFLHVERRCRRLRMHQNIQPRKMTLILDLDETLVHSSVKPMVNYDWQVHVPTTGEQRGSTFFVAVRPHTAMFLRAVSKWYEVVVFTASLQHYADPVIDLIDTDGCVSRRFFRSACKVQHGNFLKDITAVRADLSQVVLVDNSPIAYSLQEENGVPISTWIDDPNDDALATILPVLQGLALLNDVRSILRLRTSNSRDRKSTQAGDGAGGWSGQRGGDQVARPGGERGGVSQGGGRESRGRGHRSSEHE